jgi:hypothetical protein
MGLHRNYQSVTAEGYRGSSSSCRRPIYSDCAIVYPGSAQVSSNALEATSVRLANRGRSVFGLSEEDI